MRRERTYSGVLGEWKRLLQGLEENATDLNHLEGSRTKLTNMLTNLELLFQEQALRRSEKQEATKRIQDLVSEGQRLVTLLRAGVKEHYGIGAEKLVEFGVPPFRGRRPAPPVAPGPEVARRGATTIPVTEPSAEPVTDLKAERVEES